MHDTMRRATRREACERRHGVGLPNTLVSSNDLGMSLKVEGELTDAEPIDQRALKVA